MKSYAQGEHLQHLFLLKCTYLTSVIWKSDHSHTIDQFLNTHAPYWISFKLQQHIFKLGSLLITKCKYWRVFRSHVTFQEEHQPNILQYEIFMWTLQIRSSFTAATDVTFRNVSYQTAPMWYFFYLHFVNVVENTILPTFFFKVYYLLLSVF